ncbi:hypothetical protein EI94DRAFT_1727669 [Lactarius quietus]|nr:hypothetical protein EI94DRAFT_1727669 [Lactarius quietus]
MYLREVPLAATEPARVESCVLVVPRLPERADPLDYEVGWCRAIWSNFGVHAPLRSDCISVTSSKQGLIAAEVVRVPRRELAPRGVLFWDTGLREE